MNVSFLKSPIATVLFVTLTIIVLTTVHPMPGATAQPGFQIVLEVDGSISQPGDTVHLRVYIINSDDIPIAAINYVWPIISRTGAGGPDYDLHKQSRNNPSSQEVFYFDWTIPSDTPLDSYDIYVTAQCLYVYGDGTSEDIWRDYFLANSIDVVPQFSDYAPIGLALVLFVLVIFQLGKRSRISRSNHEAHELTSLKKGTLLVQKALLHACRAQNMTFETYKCC